MNFEAKNFGYSLKNIPIPTRKCYLKCLVEKVESLIIRMRWKCLFYERKLNKMNNDNQNESYGFKSKKTPPQNDLLKPFEEDLISLIRNISFKSISDEFLNQLDVDKDEIKSSEKVLVFADKTTNIYPVSKNDYRKLLRESVTKDYKKTKSPMYDEINEAAVDIAYRLNLEDKIECFAKKDSFITLKDHKDNFLNNPTCRLINPTKSEVGKISKIILEKVNKEIRAATSLIQWRNSSEVIVWFKQYSKKSNCKFIQFDVCNFYPSISQSLLNDSITFAQNYCKISNDELDIIMQARKSLLFSANEEWVRNKSDGTTELFDVTMGSYDGAEVCELVGLYLLSQIRKKIKDVDIGLYRDDGLAITYNLSGARVERIKKEIVTIFKENHNLEISIDANLSVVNFLDVTFNLKNKTFYPYRKPNDTPLYVHRSSNHPKNIIKQLPEMINRRVCEISCNKHEFTKARPLYENALKKSGFNHKMEFKEYIKAPRKRKRNVTWFNPPFSKNVTTNIGKIFLKMIDKHFPQNHKYRSLFNRSNLKVSYCCMPNMEKIIKSHNAAVLREKIENTHKCNCRRPRTCPMNGNCLASCVVYKASVKSENEEKVYYGSCMGTFKERYGNHKKSFINESYREDTKLSKYLWDLSEQSIQYEITWSIAARCKPYQPTSGKCDLCLSEKLFIVQGDPSKMINKKSEIANKCRHSNKFSLGKLLTKRIQL